MTPILVLAAFIAGYAAPLEKNGTEAQTAHRAAELRVARGNVRREANTESAIIGVLERGDRVDVRECVPACGDPTGWALLEPMGAVRLSLLTFELSSAETTTNSRFVYGRVRRPGANVRAAPSLESSVTHSHAPGHILAFQPELRPERAGWLALVQGGYVAESRVKLVEPSSFKGVHYPPRAVAFFLRTSPIESAESNSLEPTTVERHAWLPAVGRTRDWVHVPGGRVARNAVRLATERARPEGVPLSARWIHVDLREQTLTAYEGNQLVFATLVSSGKSGWETPTGLFRVWFKLRHGTMTGQLEPYHVEEVPAALFFHGSVAVHGAAWHDRFGVRASHGCINLSPADAEWLFEWAPPPLPSGWHSLLPGATELETLWVFVEDGATTRIAVQSIIHFRRRPSGLPSNQALHVGPKWHPSGNFENVAQGAGKWPGREGEPNEGKGVAGMRAKPLERGQPGGGTGRLTPRVVLEDLVRESTADSSRGSSKSGVLPAAQASGAQAALPRPPPHHCQPPDDERGEPGCGATHPSAQRPPPHDRGLWTPRRQLPPGRD